jgi:hypothetical protein
VSTSLRGFLTFVIKMIQKMIHKTSSILGSFSVYNKDFS